MPSRYRRWPSHGVWLRTKQALRAGFTGYWEDETVDWSPQVLARYPELDASRDPSWWPNRS